MWNVSHKSVAFITQQTSLQARYTNCQSKMTLTTLLLLITLPSIHSFASFFVDRRTSCFTSLLVDEVIMNHPVVDHTHSEHEVYIELYPNHNDGEYSVEFVVPEALKDVQYVLELSQESSATFINPPKHGGIGCEDKRVYGKPSDGSAEIKIHEGEGDGKIELRGGWATGHEAVTLVKPIIMTPEGMHSADDDSVDDAHDAYAYEDDQAEAEHEEEVIEEERAVLDSEVEEAERDAIEALEEKRLETPDKSKDINEAEEEVVEVLEEKRKEMDKALNSLKDEIIIEKAENSKIHEAKMAEMHRTEAQREAIRKAHAEELARKHLGVDQEMQAMEKHFKDKDDLRRKKMEHFQKLRERFKGNTAMLEELDRVEKDRRNEENFRDIPKEEVDVDMEQIKQTVHKHMMDRHHSNVEKSQKENKNNQQRAKDQFRREAETQRSGVHEMVGNRDVKLVVDRLRGNLKKGIPRGGEAAHHGDSGQPLPSKARNILLGLFGLVGMVCLVQLLLDKRRRMNKGHTA